MRYLFFLLFVLGVTVLPGGSLVAANGVTERTKGKILLAVEDRGEAWYVAPVSGLRHRLGSPSEAFDVMRTFGLGIASSTLRRIPTVTQSGAIDPALLPHVAGRILLDVEANGEAWYVDPDTGHRYALGSPEEAYRTMSTQGLGISDENLAQIPVGEVRGTYVSHAAMFVPQAPFGEWWDQRQNEGCEEATALIAVNWARGNPAIDYHAAREVIIAAAEQQGERYGSYQDTSVADTAQRIFREYFDFTDLEVRTNIDANDIVDALVSGHVVAVGVNARSLGNPWYQPPGPLQHMVLVVGYDPLADQFIVHDPGTRRGASMRFGATAFEDALLDYPSGYREPILMRPASMIVIGQEA